MVGHLQRTMLSLWLHLSESNITKSVFFSPILAFQSTEKTHFKKKNMKFPLLIIFIFISDEHNPISKMIPQPIS